jgi:hypothetical protein
MSTLPGTEGATIPITIASRGATAWFTSASRARRTVRELGPQSGRRLKGRHGSWRRVVNVEWTVSHPVATVSMSKGNSSAQTLDNTAVKPGSHIEVDRPVRCRTLNRDSECVGRF